MNVTLETHGLARWYGDVVGLSGADLEVGPGVTGLLGPNGAGKSTLLKVLTGQIRASRGTYTMLAFPTRKTMHSSSSRATQIVRTPPELLITATRLPRGSG